MSQEKKRRQSEERGRLDRRPLAVITVFILFWLAGIALGEPGQVLSQAIRICLSCIGIG